MGSDYFQTCWEIEMLKSGSGKACSKLASYSFLNLSLRLWFCSQSSFSSELSGIYHLELQIELADRTAVNGVYHWQLFSRNNGHVLWLCYSVQHLPATSGCWARATEGWICKLCLIKIHLNVNCYMWLRVLYWTIQTYTRKSGIDWILENSMLTFSLLIF